MPRLERTPNADAFDVDRLYVDHQGAVMAMLTVDFPRLRDREEIYQEAWTELLELRERTDDEPIRHVRALLKQIAWRRAADESRRRRADLVDPTGPVLAAVSDPRAAPEEQVERRLEVAALRMAIDELDPREAAAIKLRFDRGLSSVEIQEELGVTAKRLEKIVTSAYAKVLAVLSPTAGELSPLQRHQRSLLVACELGIATGRQRRRAEQMVELDPWCRSVVREMRETLHDVAAVLPMPVLVAADERHGRRLEALGGWLHDLAASARGTVRAAAERLPGGGSHAGEGAAAGGSILGGGAAAKLAAGCLAVGGGAAVCAVSLRPSPPPSKPSEPVERATRASVTPVPDRVAPKPDPPKAKAKTPKKATKPKSRPTATTQSTRSEPPVSSPASTPPASPAPAGATEFGPGAVGSAPAPSAPAAAPTNGGGEFTP